MVFADVELGSGAICLKVPQTAVTLQENKAWVIKSNPSATPVQVTVISQSSDFVLLNPVEKGVLTDGDIIATNNVPFLFKELRTLKHLGAKP